MSTVMENTNPPFCPEWEAGISLHNLNIKRNTCQCMVLIYYNLDEVSFGKFRNTMIAHNPVMRAYGNGEFLGIAKDICCVEGVFPRNQNIGILTFDHVEEAKRCIESKVELREPHHYGGHELYIVPLCNPMQSWPGYRYVQLDIYETKNSNLFTKYINNLVNIVTRHGGHVIAGTTQVGQFLGLRKALFLFVVQWKSRESFFECNKEADDLFCPPQPKPEPVDDSNIMTYYDDDCFNVSTRRNECHECKHPKKVTPLQRESGASCSSRLLFELDTQYFNWC